MNKRVALFGGSFDPIHHGHLIIARAIAEKLRLLRVILLPSAHPPHKPIDALTRSDHRAAMVRLAIQNDPLFEFSDHDLVRNGPSFTIDTIKHFRTTLEKETELYWIIGEDSLVELPSWRSAAELVDACRIVTAARQRGTGVDWDVLASAFSKRQLESLRDGLLDTPVIEISSTDIRERLQCGLTIRNLVPPVVDDYIEEHRLYRSLDV